MEGLNFSLDFCRVYHTSGTLRHVYGGVHQLEGILDTFQIRLFLSLIMGFIVGGFKFFSKFLSGLSNRRHIRARVWACTPTRGNCGHI